MIVITIEGGMIQGVSSDDPYLVGEQVVLIDYDYERADPDEIRKVPQGDGEKQDAIIGRMEIGALQAPVAEFLKANQ